MIICFVTITMIFDATVITVNVKRGKSTGAIECHRQMPVHDGIGLEQLSALPLSKNISETAAKVSGVDLIKTFTQRGIRRRLIDVGEITKMRGSGGIYGTAQYCIKLQE